MPRLVRAVPKYRKHKASGQALVTLNGRDHYLGPHNSAVSIAEYDRLIAEYLASGRTMRGDQPTIVRELTAEFLTHARSYYVKDGKQTTEVGAFVRVVKTLIDHYGDGCVTAFGPLALKTCRAEWLATGATRETVNKKQGRLVRIFKWGVANELVPVETWRALTSVETLHKGRTEAPDMREIPPVEDDRVDAVLPFLSPVVRSMIHMQRLTGMRPGEVCRLRPGLIDRSNDIWEFAVTGHKTEHHGRIRVVYIGPEAQAILTPYMLRAADAHCFSASESREWHRQQAAQRRTTPASCGNARGRKRDARPAAANRRKPRNYFVTSSYGKAIADACRKAWPAPDSIAKDPEAVKAWSASHRWAPNQLRHSCGTAVRKQFGLEAAQVILGHSKADVTQIYAERDRDKAIKVSRQIG